MTDETRTGAADSDQAKIDEVRRDAVDLFDRVLERASKLALGEPPDPLRALRSKLEENRYRVLVLGEAKRGKSTFLNALVGRELLPTDVDIATSRVFRVTRSEKERFRVRFEDGTSRQIGERDLASLGSQVVIDRDGEAEDGEAIKWIEVEGPHRFLPPDLEVLDTPGLGALYAAHAMITHRFVPDADAVILVLDSESPIGEAELRLLERVLEVTSRVFFVQTKIDLHARSAWTTVARRNEEILRERFGERLGDVVVWPVSSRNLLKAGMAEAPSDAEALELVSRHREMMSGLKRFLFESSGVARILATLVATERYAEQCRRRLEGRVTDLDEGDAAARAADRVERAERVRRFEADWAPGGRKGDELRLAIEKAVTVGRQAIKQDLQASGAVSTAQLERIERLTSVRDAQSLAETIGPSMTDHASERWHRVWSQTDSRVAELLRPFADDVEVFSSGWTVVRIDRPRSPVVSGDLWEKFKLAKSEMGALMGIAGVLAYTPLALATPLVMLWGLSRGWKKAELRQTDTAKSDLRRHCEEVRRSLWRFFCEADVEAGQFSRLEEHANAFLAATARQLDDVIERRLAEARREAELLDEQGRLDEAERSGRVRGVRDELAGWQEVRTELEGLASRVGELATTVGGASGAAS